MKAIRLFCCLTVLAAFTSGVKIECDYKLLEGKYYTCSAKVISVENPTTIAEITGTHWIAKTNADVRGFQMKYHKVLTAIPEGIEKFFKDLEAFWWLDGNISTIDSSTFKPFPNLQVINLYNNKLVSLDGDLFQHTRKLRAIHFERNLLEHVGHDLMTGLIGPNGLLVVNFTSNPCTKGSSFDSDHQKIQEINLQLPIKCPPLFHPTTTAASATTTISKDNNSEPNECPISCMGRIEKLEKRIREMVSSPYATKSATEYNILTA